MWTIYSSMHHKVSHCTLWIFFWPSSKRQLVRFPMKGISSNMELIILRKFAMNIYYKYMYSKIWPKNLRSIYFLYMCHFKKSNQYYSCHGNTVLSGKNTLLVFFLIHRHFCLIWHSYIFIHKLRELQPTKLHI